MDLCFGIQCFLGKLMWKEDAVLLGIDGALLFGGEEQFEQDVEQSVPQQNEAG